MFPRMPCSTGKRTKMCLRHARSRENTLLFMHGRRTLGAVMAQRCPRDGLPFALAQAAS